MNKKKKENKKEQNKEKRKEEGKEEGRRTPRFAAVVFFANNVIANKELDTWATTLGLYKGESATYKMS